MGGWSSEMKVENLLSCKNNDKYIIPQYVIEILEQMNPKADISADFDLIRDEYKYELYNIDIYTPSAGYVTLWDRL